MYTKLKHVLAFPVLSLAPRNDNIRNVYIYINFFVFLLKKINIICMLILLSVQL